MFLPLSPRNAMEGFLENGAFLVAICPKIAISRHFRGAIVLVRLAICAFLHKFSTVIFANLLKTTYFSKVGRKRRAFPVRVAPTALRWTAIASGNHSGICNAFSCGNCRLSAVGSEYASKMGRVCPIPPIVCPCRGSYRTPHR